MSANKRPNILKKQEKEVVRSIYKDLKIALNKLYKKEVQTR